MFALFGLSLFWLALIEFSVLFILVVNERETAATISLFIFGLAVHFFTGVNVITFFKHNGTTLLKLAALYAGLGLGWSLAKWFFHVRNIREQYDSFVEAHKDIKYTKGDVERTLGEIPPRAARHKGRIVSWISYWPISVIWTFLDDFLKKLFNRIYDLFSGVFQRISNAQFKDVK